MPDYATQALYCSAATTTFLQKLLSLYTQKYASMHGFIFSAWAVIYRWHNYFNQHNAMSQCQCNGKYS